MKDLSEPSHMLRSQVLGPSGGWIGELIIYISHSLRIWDISVSLFIFLMALGIMARCHVDTSVMVGLLFDLIVPYQHFKSERRAKRHKKHLEDYWPVFIIASIGELACYILLQTRPFKMVLCIKTAGATWFWLSRRPDGSKISFKKIYHAGDNTPSASNGSVDPSALISSGGGQVPTSVPSDIRPTAFIDPSMPMDPRVPNANERLLAAGFTDPLTREGMINLLLTSRDQAMAEKNVDHFERAARTESPEKLKQRIDRYKSNALKKRALVHGMKRNNRSEGRIKEAVEKLQYAKTSEQEKELLNKMGLSSRLFDNLTSADVPSMQIGRSDGGQPVQPAQGSGQQSQGAAQVDGAVSSSAGGPFENRWREIFLSSKDMERYRVALKAKGRSDPEIISGLQQLKATTNEGEFIQKLKALELEEERRFYVAEDCKRELVEIMEGMRHAVQGKRKMMVLAGFDKLHNIESFLDYRDTIARCLCHHELDPTIGRGDRLEGLVSRDWIRAVRQFWKRSNLEGGPGLNGGTVEGMIEECMGQPDVGTAEKLELIWRNKWKAEPEQTMREMLARYKDYEDFSL